MSYVYKSTTGYTVNVGSYVVSVSGMYADAPIPELELLVNNTIERISDTVQEPVEEPEKSPVFTTPEPEPTPAPVEVIAE